MPVIISLNQKRIERIKQQTRKEYKDCESIVVHNIITDCEDIIDSEDTIEFEEILEDLYDSIGDYFELKTLEV